MPRIAPLSRDSAPAATQELYDAVQKKMGVVPNLISTMAHSKPVAEAYLAFSGALSGGVLPATLREKLALLVGETNGCDYCVAAHTALGKMTGLSDDALLDARRGDSSDAAEGAALRFAERLVSERGRVNDDDLRSVRDAGYDDGEIGEIVANVALNLFTNYFNHTAETAIDFPAAPALVG